MELLLDRGAAIDAQDEQGTTALAWATEEQADAVSALLLARGAQAGPVDLAACGMAVELRGLLEREPWTIDQGTMQGTAVHAAVRRGQAATLDVLLERGADLCVRDGDGWTALELARKLGHGELEAALARALEVRGEAPCAGGTQASESASYRCGACGEEIVIDVDRTEGETQTFVEDCPVCCRANEVNVRWAEGAGAAVRAHLE